MGEWNDMPADERKTIIALARQVFDSIYAEYEKHVAACDNEDHAEQLAIFRDKAEREAQVFKAQVNRDFLAGMCAAVDIIGEQATAMMNVGDPQEIVTGMIVQENARIALKAIFVPGLRAYDPRPLSDGDITPTEDRAFNDLVAGLSDVAKAINPDDYRPGTYL